MNEQSEDYGNHISRSECVCHFYL